MTLSLIQAKFTAWDWGIVVAYLLLTTWIGHAVSGKNSTIRDFFLGGRTLPWWAVSGSMIATEISALTFIGVPGTVFALQGDWTYLQWGIGSILARFAVAYWLVPLYYQREIYSPYDYMGERLGEGVHRLVTGLFSMGAILGQSVRVLVTAIILNTVTGMSMDACIISIGAFAVVWTLMGGMRTVIWTDVIQFVIFILGGILALTWLGTHLGWSDIIESNRHAGPDGQVNKLRVFNFAAPWNEPLLNYTFWVGVLAMPFQNLAAFGTDQLNAQRIFCCRNAKDARKAVIWSSASLLTTLLMLAVGAGLFCWYQTQGMTPDEAAKFAENPNYVFPVWITTVLPTGLSGLILAGAFAAAISSLDSVLAALSQTSLSAWYGRSRLQQEGNGPAMVLKSRILVVAWATILSSFALLMANGYQQNENKNLIDLAFGMVAYTYGPLLGVLLAAIIPGKRSIRGLMIGIAVSVAIVAWIRPEIRQVLDACGMHEFSQALLDTRPKIADPWFYPINAAITVLSACLPWGDRQTQKN